MLVHGENEKMKFLMDKIKAEFSMCVFYCLSVFAYCWLVLACLLLLFLSIKKVYIILHSVGVPCFKPANGESITIDTPPYIEVDIDTQLLSSSITGQGFSCLFSRFISDPDIVNYPCSS